MSAKRTTEQTNKTNSYLRLNMDLSKMFLVGVPGAVLSEKK